MPTGSHQRKFAINRTARAQQGYLFSTGLRHYPCDKMKKRRSGHTNAKRQIQADVPQEDLSRLAKAITYGGNPEHKSDPGRFRLQPPSVPRLDKALCDPTGVRTPTKARSILRSGIMKGLVSVQWRGDYPQNIWRVSCVPTSGERSVSTDRFEAMA